jgi:hypothetical protein
VTTYRDWMREEEPDDPPAELKALYEAAVAYLGKYLDSDSPVKVYALSDEALIAFTQEYEEKYHPMPDAVENGEPR